MTLQTSGAISLGDIQGEYGGSNPISMSEYVRNGSHVNAYTSNRFDVNAPVFKWQTTNNSSGFVQWNNSTVASGLGNSTETTAGSFTYQRGSLQSTVDVKGQTTRLYQVRRKYSGTANNDIPTSTSSMQMSDFYGGVGSD